MMYAIYDKNGDWLFNVRAESLQLALNAAVEADLRAYKAVLVSENEPARD